MAVESDESRSNWVDKQTTLFMNWPRLIWRRVVPATIVFALLAADTSYWFDVHPERSYAQRLLRGLVGGIFVGAVPILIERWLRRRVAR